MRRYPLDKWDVLIHTIAVVGVLAAVVVSFFV